MLAPLWPLVPFFEPCALHFCVLVLLVCMIEIKFNPIKKKCSTEAEVFYISHVFRSSKKC